MRFRWVIQRQAYRPDRLWQERAEARLPLHPSHDRIVTSPLPRWGEVKTRPVPGMCSKVGGRWCYLYRAIDRDSNLLDTMLGEHRDRKAARRFLRRSLKGAAQKPLRLTTGRHHARRKAIRWIEGRKVLHRQNRYLNNRIEQSHRPIKQRYYPMLGFKRFDSASRFCTDFDELRHYLRIRPARSEPVTSSRRRTIFATRWSTLKAGLAA